MSTAASETSSAWRKRGERLRKAVIDQDDQQFLLSNTCPIDRYFNVADKVLDQFLHHPIDTREEIMEAYMVGHRLVKFLSSILPTHKDYPTSAKVDSSREQLASVLQYLEQIAMLIDKQEHEDFISSVLESSSHGGEPEEFHLPQSHVADNTKNHTFDGSSDSTDLLNNTTVNTIDSSVLEEAQERLMARTSVAAEPGFPLGIAGNHADSLRRGQAGVENRNHPRSLSTGFSSEDHSSSRDTMSGEYGRETQVNSTDEYKSTSSYEAEDNLYVSDESSDKPRIVSPETSRSALDSSKSTVKQSESHSSIHDVPIRPLRSSQQSSFSDESQSNRFSLPIDGASRDRLTTPLPLIQNTIDKTSPLRSKHEWNEQIAVDSEDNSGWARPFEQEQHLRAPASDLPEDAQPLLCAPNIDSEIKASTFSQDEHASKDSPGCISSSFSSSVSSCHDDEDDEVSTFGYREMNPPPKIEPEKEVKAEEGSSVYWQETSDRIPAFPSVKTRYRASQQSAGVENYNNMSVDSSRNIANSHSEKIDSAKRAAREFTDKLFQQEESSPRDEPLHVVQPLFSSDKLGFKKQISKNGEGLVGAATGDLESKSTVSIGSMPYVARSSGANTVDNAKGFVPKFPATGVPANVAASDSFDCIPSSEFSCNHIGNDIRKLRQQGLSKESLSGSTDSKRGRGDRSMQEIRQSDDRGCIDGWTSDLQPSGIKKHQSTESIAFTTCSTSNTSAVDWSESDSPVQDDDVSMDSMGFPRFPSKRNESSCFPNRGQFGNPTEPIQEFGLSDNVISEKGSGAEILAASRDQYDLPSNKWPDVWDTKEKEMSKKATPEVPSYRAVSAKRTNGTNKKASDTGVEASPVKSKGSWAQIWASDGKSGSNTDIFDISKKNSNVVPQLPAMKPWSLATGEDAPNKSRDSDVSGQKRSMGILRPVSGRKLSDKALQSKDFDPFVDTMSSTKDAQIDKSVDPFPKNGLRSSLSSTRCDVLQPFILESRTEERPKYLRPSQAEMKDKTISFDEIYNGPPSASLRSETKTHDDTIIKQREGLNRRNMRCRKHLAYESDHIAINDYESDDSSLLMVKEKNNRGNFRGCVRFLLD